MVIYTPILLVFVLWLSLVVQSWHALVLPSSVRLTCSNTKYYYHRIEDKSKNSELLGFRTYMTSYQLQSAYKMISRVSQISNVGLISSVEYWSKSGSILSWAFSVKRLEKITIFVNCIWSKIKRHS